MKIIEFSDGEINILKSLLDLSLKASGLSVIKEVVSVYNIMLAAKEKEAYLKENFNIIEQYKEASKENEIESDSNISKVF